jgi:hypothetical protein
MKRSGLRTLNSIVIAGILLLASIALAADDIATVVAVRGKTVIDRNRLLLEAKVKDPVLLVDTVSTGDASRTKLLFVDDSVLTMGEKSKVVIKEFVYSKEKGGKSIFNLIDGKMKSVVGKAGFEVHTPTAVAAARGTVIFFEVGPRDGKLCTTILCTEGEVVAASPDPNVKDDLTLTSDTIVTICEGMPFPATTLRPQSAEKETMIRDTSIGGYEIAVPRPAQMEAGLSGFGVTLPLTPPIPNQQPVNRTPVTIDIIFQ